MRCAIWIRLTDFVLISHRCLPYCICTFVYFVLASNSCAMLRKPMHVDARCLMKNTSCSSRAIERLMVLWLGVSAGAVAGKTHCFGVAIGRVVTYISWGGLSGETEA